MRFLISMVAAVCLLVAGCSDKSAEDSGITQSSIVAGLPESASATSAQATTTTSGPLVSDEPEGVLAEEVFPELSGDFSYVTFTDQQVRDLRNDLFGGDDDTVLFLRDFTARQIQRGSGPENLIVVYVVDPVAAADPEWQQSLETGFAQGADSRLIVIGTQSLTEVEDETGFHLLWQTENVFMMFHGRDKDELYAAARAVMEPISGPFPTTTTTFATTTSSSLEATVVTSEG